MTPEEENRFAEHERVIQLLRDQVDGLQIKAEEKEEPWYKQTPSLTSVLALLLSIATAIYSGVEGHYEDVEKKQESLRGIISNLLDLGTEQQSRLNSAAAQKLSKAEREFVGGMLNNKRMMLSEAADNIVREIPRHVSSSEYDLLAADKLNNGGAAAAQNYLQAATKATTDPLLEMIALRNLAAFYAQRGPFQNISTARDYFQRAVVSIGEPRDDYTAYALGFTWENWGISEFMNDFPEQARQKMENARKYYNEMSAGNPLRADALGYLEQRLQLFQTWNGAPASSLPTPASSFPVPAATSPAPVSTAQPLPSQAGYRTKN